MARKEKTAITRSSKACTEPFAVPPDTLKDEVQDQEHTQEEETCTKARRDLEGKKLRANEQEN